MPEYHRLGAGGQSLAQGLIICHQWLEESAWLMPPWKELEGDISLMCYIFARTPHIEEARLSASIGGLSVNKPNRAPTVAPKQPK
jgi:hypothetical protein